MISYPGLVKSYSSYFDTPTRKNYLNLGVTLITLIVLVLMVYPAVLYIFDISSQLSKNREISEAMTQKLSDIQKANTNISNLNSSLNIIDESLPNSADIPQYLKTLEANLANSNAVISNLTFNETPLSSSDSKTVPQINNVTYSLTLIGDYQNLRNSLEKLEKLSRFTDIESAAFNSKKEADNQLQLILRAKTYFYGAVDPTVIAGSR